MVKKSVKKIKPMDANKPSYKRTQNYIMPKKNDTKINPKEIFEGFKKKVD